MSYNLTEIFSSIQGEGQHTGQKAIFIRFSGCNLDCHFCDEPTHKASGTDYSQDRLLDELKRYKPCQFVVLTGGEPTIHPQFDDLVELLQKHNYFVALETNGTKSISSRPDWITVSPKTNTFITGDELKLVYQNQNLKEYEDLPFTHFFLQPMNHQNDINYHSVNQCLKIIEENPKWRLSLQIHKLLKIK